MLSAEQKTELSKPLNPTFIKQRRQAGRELSYIEGWHAIAEANRIFGFDGWDRETLDLRELGDARQVEGKWRVAYMARVRIRVRPDILREGCGYGSGIDRDMGSAHESALKEAETDAMKRALMTFGNQFGLALYDKEQRGVGVEKPEPEPELPAMPELGLGAITINGEPQRLSAYAARKEGQWEPLVDVAPRLPGHAVPQVLGRGSRGGNQDASGAMGDPSPRGVQREDG